jgi:putative FmdB family regulatory protein
VAAYDYRCRVCDTRFEVRRGMSDAAGEVCCPLGHDEVSRIWTAVAVTGASSSLSGRARAPAPAAVGGGCCGGGCGCG